MSDFSNELLSDLILRIYRAAEEPAEWVVCLERLRRAFEGTGAAILYQDREAPNRDVQVFAGYTAEAIALYEKYYYRLDPWASRLTPKEWIAGRIVYGEEVVSRALVRGGEWFADFGEEHGCDKALIGFLEPLGTRVSAITISRGVQQVEFGSPEVQLFRSLVPHLRQALRLHRRLSEADGIRSAACDALERLPVGVYLLDEDGTPLFVNRFGQALANRHDGLRLNKHHVSCASPSDTERLRTAIDEAVRLGRQQFVEAGPRCVAIGRPSGKLPLSAIVVPAGHRDTGLGSEVRAAAALFVSDPDLRPVHADAQLSALFDLTNAEARVAARLVNGESVGDIAGALDMSVNTVRWHVKHILQKAQVKTQAQFVSVALRGMVRVVE